MTMTDDDTDIETLERELSMLNTDIVIFESEISDPILRKNAIDAEQRKVREEMQQRLLDLNAEKIRIDEEMFDKRRQFNAAKAKRESLQRTLEQAKRRRLAEAHFEQLETRWNNIIRSASWAAEIKDFQIVTAKRIATQRDIIIAHTMGLGKTLCAIASWDLIYTMTQEASDTNPLILEDL